MSFNPDSFIQTCIKVAKYAADVRHSSKERGRLLDEVRSLQSQLEAFQKSVETTSISGDETAMGQLAKVLDSSEPFAKVLHKTLERVKEVLTYGTSDPTANRFKVLGKRGAAALWWTVDKAEIQELLLDLERCKSRIGLALQHDTFKHIITEYRLKVAKFVSENNFVGHQRSLIEKRLPETGTWVLRHPTFVAWRDNENAERTVWCHGFAGVGKSVIAAFIVEQLRSTPGTIVLSVFCRYDKVTTLTTPFPVLRGLLRQLIEKSTIVPPALAGLYQSQTEPKPDLLRGFLNDLAAAHARPIYIVIDALDECPIRIDLLRAVQGLATSFRILVTSRPVFGEIHEHTTIEIRAVDEDILTAVEATLQKLKHPWLDEELQQTIRAKIVEKADGMFLLASLQLGELERDVTRPSDVVAILESLPRTLDDAYKSTFQRIREQGERKNKLVCHTLAIIALHPLLSNFNTVQHLLVEGDKTQYMDIEAILQCCHGLVRKDSSFLVLIHHSLHEFITAHWSELFPENPDRIAICLKLGFSVLPSPIDKSGMNCCYWMVRAMREPQELEQVISFLSTPAARASLVKHYPELASIVHDPLLIACHRWYWNVMEYMIQTAPPDVQRFVDALRACRNSLWGPTTQKCIECINARPDVRVNSEGVVVVVDPDGGDGN